MDSKNNIWVLGVYGLLFGAGLPALVGRWWFGSRKYTKDGVQTRTAELFFKVINEEITEKDIVLSLGKALTWEKPSTKAKSTHDALRELNSQVISRLGDEWMSNSEVKHTKLFKYYKLSCNLAE